MQHFKDDALEDYISNHSLPGDEEIASLDPATFVCPRLAMLDEPTLLEITGHISLSHIEVSLLSQWSVVVEFVILLGSHPVQQPTDKISIGNKLASTKAVGSGWK